MKKLIAFFQIIFVLIFFTSLSNAQVSNLQVIGSSSPFTITSGDNLSWSYNLSTGGTSNVEIWVDVNANLSIDQGVDILMFQFLITDGDPEGENGPPDMDEEVNGAISFGPMALGLTPSSYILNFTENSVGQMLTGTVAHLTSPSFTVSGKVTASAGFNVKDVIIEMNRDEEIPGVFFWNAITDGSGNYTIEVSADSTGPWELAILSEQNPFPTAIITPEYYEFYLSTTNTGYDFDVQKADAKVVGTLKDENGTPLPYVNVTLRDDNYENEHYVDTDINGNFQIGLSSDELNGQKWFLQAGLHYSQDGDTSTNFMDPRVELENAIVLNDSINQDLTAYFADTTITGIVSFQGMQTGNIPEILLIASTDSAESYAYNDTITGNYSLRVSSKLGPYSLFGVNIPGEYEHITFHDIQPGATNIDFNYTLTDVEKINGSLPTQFGLKQNYPNPFNPSTTINYTIPDQVGNDNVIVQLKVYDVLGREITTLVNNEQSAGSYKVQFDANNLGNGVYFYQIIAGSFVDSKKMILLK